jgi:hypothetical protein
VAARLHINAKSDFGEILIEVLDAKGHWIATSKPVRRDGLDIPAAWESGTKWENPTQQVALRISLKKAHLFAVWDDGGRQ